MKIYIYDFLSFKIEFQNISDGSGKRYTKGPYEIDLKQDLIVKLFSFCKGKIKKQNK